MAEDVADDFGLHAEFHLSASVGVAQHVGAQVRCRDSGSMRVGVQDMANANRTGQRLVGRPHRHEHVASPRVPGPPMAQVAHSTRFGHLFQGHPAGDSSGIRPSVPRGFGRGSRSEATQV